MQPDSTLDAVYGVDFSAAAKTAGASTWIARCVPGPDGGLVVRDLASASEFLDIGSTDRSDVLPALADRLGRVAGPAVAGLDFPFSLPAWALGDDDWPSFVAGTPEEWGVLDGVETPEDLFYSVNDAADVRGVEPRRATDGNHGGQDPAGWRIKTQTYYGISALLRPLVARDDVAVPPVRPVEDPRLAVLETYPAAVFDRLDGGVRTGYKRSQRRHVAARKRNVDALRDAGVRFADDTAVDCAVATDDALDAVAAAVAAARNYPDALERDYDADDRLEARIFA